MKIKYSRRESGQRRLTPEDAREAFSKKTGRDPEEPELQMLIGILRSGLRLAHEDYNRVYTETPAEDGGPPLVTSTSPSRGRGGPPIHPQIEEGICRLVRTLGTPQGVALLILLYGLEQSPAFPMFLEQDNNSDVYEAVLRPMEKRLSRIEKACQREFTPFDSRMWPTFED